MSRIRKLKMERIISHLKEVLRSSKMESADFTGISFGESELPKKTQDVTDFIKKTTRLYRMSWIIDPLERIIEEIENEIVR